MYLTKNLYSYNVTYVDLPDKDVFHLLINEAKRGFNENADYFESADKEQIDNWKKSRVPVLYASKVAKQKPEDFSLLRHDMNERACRSYLVIDADFNADQRDISEQFYNKLVNFASELNTPLVIYPTASYPDKPRYRAVFFTKKKLDAVKYGQAMNWLYASLGIPDELAKDPDIYESLSREEQVLFDAMDLSNKHIKSNNNAPFFTNNAQLEMIYDTTQVENLELLDNELWKDAEKPKIAKQKTYGPANDLDTLTFEDDDILEKATKNFAKTDFAQNYNTFWRFLHTIARAEITQQLTRKQVDKVLSWVAENPDTERSLVWKLNNKEMYSIEFGRVASNDDYFSKARPLATYPEYKAALLAEAGYDFEKDDVS